jgi:hypothetical protein
LTFAAPRAIVACGFQRASGGKPVDLHRQNVSSINWSGSVTTAALTFEMVQGEWYVPAVTGAVPTYCGTNVWNESSMWAGLDGAATNDLIQDGTEQYVESVREVTCTTYYLKTYDAFVEYWSTSGNNYYSPFNVSPTDEIYAEAWSGDVDGNVTATGAYGWYYIEDITASNYLQVSLVKPSGATFSGQTAEWILENPNSAAQNLADYSTTAIFDAYSYDTTNTWITAYSQGTTQWQMYDQSVLLSSTTAPNSSSYLDFTWHNW